MVANLTKSKKSNLAKFKMSNLTKAKTLDFVKANSFRTDFFTFKTKEDFT